MTGQTKKIAIVVPRYGRVGGGEHFVMALTEHLAKRQAFQLHVFANQWDEPSQDITFHKVPIITFPRFLTTISFAYFANQRIAKTGMDLIHTHDRILNADLFTAHGLPHRLWIKEVRRKRLSLFDRMTSWVEERLITDPQCQKILPVSKMTRDKIVEALPQAEIKLQVMTPGVDIRPYDQLDKEQCRKRIRAQFDIADTDRVILFVGMNFDVKGLEAVMTGVAELDHLQPEQTHKLLVVGKGDTRRYGRLARQLGLESRVIFAGVWDDEMAPIYIASDLFAMLSVYDTFGLTVLEAMAAGLPVIISPTVGARDVVQQGQNGYIVTPENSAEVARCMYETLSPSRYQHMALHARQTAEKYTWSEMAKKVAAIYEQLLVSKGSENRC